MLKLNSLFILCLITHYVIAQNPLEKEGWLLTFNDEFNDGYLDEFIWKDHYYWGGRKGEKSVTYYGENQFEHTDSSILLKAEKKIINDSVFYVSGMLDGYRKFKQKYGYFEIRSKNPKGTGFLPAFWLVSTVQWPPEIDIFEFYTVFPNKMSTSLHWKNKNGNNKRKTKNYLVHDASELFHIYAIAWKKNKITWFYDNKKVKTIRRGVKNQKFPMHIIINLEISRIKNMNLDQAIFPNYFEIDYVRVYKKQSKRHFPLPHVE